MTKILTAAVRTSDGVIHVVPRPGRHADIVHALWKSKGYKSQIITAEGEQGFFADDGNFYDRKTAKMKAIESGQITTSEFPELYSEDLW